MIKAQNPFECGFRKVIPAVLVYIRAEDQVLMIHRHSRHEKSFHEDSLEYHGEHEGKWNGLGGKCELDESPLQAACREVQEESSLEIPSDQFKALAVLQFPNFKSKKQEDWMVFVFTVQLNALQINRKLFEIEGASTSEGDLHWIPIDQLESLNLWPGDRLFLPWVIQNKPFLGTLWYQDQKVIRHWITPLESP
jgi:8-oxo-dGTP diphosphatase